MFPALSRPSTAKNTGLETRQYVQKLLLERRAGRPAPRKSEHEISHDKPGLILIVVNALVYEWGRVTPDSCTPKHEKEHTLTFSANELDTIIIAEAKHAAS